MKIKVTGEVREIRENTSISELLKLEGVEMPEYVTVQVNEEFIRRKEFDNTKLFEGDEVEFMYYMGGGKA